MITIFDIIIFTILFVSSLTGVYRGMIYIAINILGFIASIVVAIFLYPYVSTILTEYVENDLVASIVSGVFSYIFSLIVFTFLSSKVVLLFKDISCGWFDRLLGFLMGVIRGVILSVLIFSFLAVFTSGVYTKERKVEDMIYKLDANKYPEWLKSSITTSYMEDSLKEAVSYVPQTWLDSIEVFNKEENKIDKIKKRKKMETRSAIESPLDEKLEEATKPPLPEDEE